MQHHHQELIWIMIRHVPLARALIFIDDILLRKPLWNYYPWREMKRSEQLSGQLGWHVCNIMTRSCLEQHWRAEICCHDLWLIIEGPRQMCQQLKFSISGMRLGSWVHWSCVTAHPVSSLSPSSQSVQHSTDVFSPVASLSGTNVVIW